MLVTGVIIGTGLPVGYPPARKKGVASHLCPIGSKSQRWTPMPAQAQMRFQVWTYEAVECAEVMFHGALLLSQSMVFFLD